MLRRFTPLMLLVAVMALAAALALAAAPLLLHAAPSAPLVAAYPTSPVAASAPHDSAPAMLVVDSLPAIDSLHAAFTDSMVISHGRHAGNAYRVVAESAGRVLDSIGPLGERYARADARVHVSSRSRNVRRSLSAIPAEPEGMLVAVGRESRLADGIAFDRLSHRGRRVRLARLDASWRATRRLT